MLITEKEGNYVTRNVYAFFRKKNGLFLFISELKRVTVCMSSDEPIVAVVAIVVVVVDRPITIVVIGRKKIDTRTPTQYNQSKRTHYENYMLMKWWNSHNNRHVISTDTKTKTKNQNYLRNFERFSKSRSLGGLCVYFDTNQLNFRNLHLIGNDLK